MSGLTIGYYKAHLVEPWRAGKHTNSELSGVGRSTVYSAVRRAGGILSTPAQACG